MEKRKWCIVDSWEYGETKCVDESLARKVSIILNGDSNDLTVDELDQLMCKTVTEETM